MNAYAADGESFASAPQGFSDWGRWKMNEPFILSGSFDSLKLLPLSDTFKYLSEYSSHLTPISLWACRRISIRELDMMIMSGIEREL